MRGGNFKRLYAVALLGSTAIAIIAVLYNNALLRGNNCCRISQRQSHKNVRCMKRAEKVKNMATAKAFAGVEILQPRRRALLPRWHYKRRSTDVSMSLLLGGMSPSCQA